MTLQEMAQKAQEYQVKWSQRVITNLEFKELVEDLDINQAVSEAAMDEEENIAAHQLIVSVLQMANVIIK